MTMTDLKSRIKELIKLPSRWFLSNVLETKSRDEHNLKPRLLWSKSIVYFVLASTTIGIVYAFTANLDEVAIVTGELKPFGNISDVKSAVSGSIAEVLAKDGQFVNSKQIVLRLDSTISFSRLNSLQQQRRLLGLRVSDQESIFNFRQQQLQSQLVALTSNFKTQNLITTRYRPLVRQGAVQELQLLEQQSKVDSIVSELQQTKSRIGELRQSYLKERKESDTSLSELDRQIVEAKRILDYDKIDAPVSGHIFDMLPLRPGTVVNAGDTLFKIVPNLKLEAKVFIPNQYIGFVRKGQAVEIRLDAYPFTEYGSIKGTVVSISDEALPPTQQIPYPRFTAKVKLQDQSLKKKNHIYPLKSGQTLTANLILRKRRVASLFTDIIERALDSMRSVRGTQT